MMTRLKNKYGRRKKRTIQPANKKKAYQAKLRAMVLNPQKKKTIRPANKEKGLSSQTTRHGPETTSTEKGPIHQTSTEKSSIHVASGIGAILPRCQPKNESLPQSIHVVQHRLSS